jgi:FkbM family methyltransferase
MFKDSLLLTTLKQIENKSSIWIYGAGTYGYMLLSSIKYYRPDIKVKGLLDRSKRGKLLDYDKGFLDNSIREALKDLPVMPLGELNEGNRDDLVIIATAPQFWAEIEQNLKSSNVDNYFINAFFDFDIYGKKKLNKILEYSKLGSEIEGIFDDAHDKNTWNIILKSIENSNVLDSLAFCTGKQSKQYDDVVRLNRGDVAINGGAVYGPDTKIFPEQVGDKGRVYEFDPRYKNEPANVGELGNVVQIPAALYDVKKKLYFVDTAGNTLVSGSSSSSSSAVDAISIDEFISENNVGRLDLIKLDIEGSELEALDGGKKSITKFRPQLAIAIYHKLEHFFEIPIYLSNLLTDYQFHVRFYEPFCTDTIFYALPLEKVDKKLR